MQQNKHEYLPRERCYFMGHEVFTKKKESKIRTFLLSRERGREGRFNSLNFNWIEIIVSLSLSLGHWKYFFQFSKIENISSQPLKCGSIYLLLLSEQKYLELIQNFTAILLLIKSKTPHEAWLLKDKFVEESSLSSWLPALKYI